MTKVALYFGSYNPVHIGHLSIANYIWQNTDVDEVWMVISPQNPFKEKSSLWDENIRVELLETAVSGHPKIRVCTIEFELPKPSYTYYTLKELRSRFPNIEFCLVVGQDIANEIINWKKGEEIIEENEFYVYPRKVNLEEGINLPNYHFLDAPRLDISSTYIRKALKEGKDIRYLVGKDVADNIAQLNIF
ncbi:MAG: nicotinate-nucleotide adenylyltransferase [Flavobacteriales bacterium]|nr:nicotinate-nucleotide adenylyltransferase [Flavobacteriales bacterium]